MDQQQHMADWWARQQMIADLDRDIAEGRRNIAERQECILMEAATQPPAAVDFSRCRSMDEMTSAQFHAWHAAGRPELPAARAEREAAERRRVEEKAAAPASVPAPASPPPAPAPDPAPAPGAMRMLGEMLADEFNRLEADLRREMRAEVQALKTEIGLRAEIQALRDQVEQLRQERGKLRVVS